MAAAPKAAGAAESLAARLGGAPAEREAALAELLALELEHRGAALASVSARGAARSAANAAARVRVDIAVACVVPLCQLLRKPAAEVGVAEWHRACQVLTAIVTTDRGRVGCELIRPGQTNMYDFFSAPENALGVALAKEPSALTAEDALTIAWTVGPFLSMMAGPKGVDAALEACGLDTMAWVGEMMPHNFLVGGTGGPTPSDDRSLALMPLFLDMLKTWEQLPDFGLQAVLMATVFGVQGRNAVAVQMVDHDAVALLTDLLHQVTPSELISSVDFSRRAHGAVFCVMADVTQGAQNSGMDLTSQLLENGFIDIMISALAAVETVGADNSSAIVITYGVLNLLKNLDGAALDQIEGRLRGAPSTLRYLVNTNIEHIRDFGYTSGTFATNIAANVFGKDVRAHTATPLMHTSETVTSPVPSFQKGAFY